MNFQKCIIMSGFGKSGHIWDNPLVDGDLLGERETGNLHDPQAMAIKR